MKTEADPKYNNFILRWLLSKCWYKISLCIHCFWLLLDTVLFMSPWACPWWSGSCLMEISQTTLLSWLRVQASQLGRLPRWGWGLTGKPTSFQYYIATNYRWACSPYMHSVWMKIKIVVQELWICCFYIFSTPPCFLTSISRKKEKMLKF